jgi:hypothetical protein
MTTENTRMFDVTEELEQYRQCLRDIWNRYLWSDSAFRDWDMVDHFNAIRPVLLSNLLREKVRRTANLNSHIQPELFVRPSVADQSGLGGAAIRISETAASQVSRDWIQAPSYIRGSDMLLRFIDFFDWDQANFRNLEYFLVAISHSARYPQLVGREALIRTSDARVIVGQPGISLDTLMAEYDQVAPPFFLPRNALE